MTRVFLLLSPTEGLLRAVAAGLSTSVQLWGLLGPSCCVSTRPSVGCRPVASLPGPGRQGNRVTGCQVSLFLKTVSDSHSQPLICDEFFSA